MSTVSKGIHVDKKILDFYIEKVNRFGNSPLGVGWKDDHAQRVRFAQLVKVIESKSSFSINDLGCGTGMFYKYLISESYLPDQYSGYDILKEMIQSAENNLLPNPAVSLSKIDSAQEIILADYTVASGIFNVKYEANEVDWLEYVLSTIESINKGSRLGFAFNMLTKYSDQEFMQSYLYYADPLFLFDYCKRNFSKNVALLHDYSQYDFTIIVRKREPR